MGHGPSTMKMHQSTFACCQGNKGATEGERHYGHGVAESVYSIQPVENLWKEVVKL